MKKRILTELMLTICVLVTATVHAGTPAFVNWKCAPPDSQRVSATAGNLLGLPQIGAPDFAVRDYNNGPGPDQRWWPYADGAQLYWGAESLQVDTRWLRLIQRKISLFMPIVSPVLLVPKQPVKCELMCGTLPILALPMQFN